MSLHTSRTYLYRRIRMTSPEPMVTNAFIRPRGSLATAYADETSVREKETAPPVEGHETPVKGHVETPMTPAVDDGGPWEYTP